MHDFRKLRVWQEAIELVVQVYAATRQFPPEERFNLSSQLTRAAVSIPSNIAEGAGRIPNGEFVHFLGIASGSCSEVPTQLIIAQRLNYLTSQQYNVMEQRLNAIQRMTATLIKNLRNQQ
ncbi:four helix bundle protein [Hymenobacter latericus]|uniref:four helix bundle protein n=1 Tax=Hymenobacter sp. YIM 151858-1 TaxID=2987688 RepID=UPI002227D79D|nr:four helix bundle protein [Hymenobacter sp. YIM 151858-1]UYZ58366.1 four helix bundle protein [Hymenobacter sp. YIM 151858-1]